MCFGVGVGVIVWGFFFLFRDFFILVRGLGMIYFFRMKIGNFV